MSLELSSSDSSSGSREPVGVATVHMGAGAWGERRGRMGLRGALGGCTLVRGKEVWSRGVSLGAGASCEGPFWTTAIG